MPPDADAAAAALLGIWRFARMKCMFFSNIFESGNGTLLEQSWRWTLVGRYFLLVKVVQ